MATLIIKQSAVDGKPFVLPDGTECLSDRFALWSSIVDNFVLFNATREDIIDYMLDTERRMIELHVDNKLKFLETRHASSDEFQARIKQSLEFHGKDAFADFSESGTEEQKST